MRKTVGELHAMLIEYEKGLPKKAETPQVMMIKGGKIQKANKKSHKAKGKGKLMARERINKGFREAIKLKQRALYLYVGNGVYAQVEAIGSFDLVLPNGLVICLDNCRYAPSITRGVVLVHRLLTPLYTPQHNGVSERRNRTLLDMGRSMMNLKTLSLSFWDYALEFAIRILNMVPTKKVDKTPYELWYGKVLNLSYLKVWRYEDLLKRDTPDKLEQRSVKCIFIGYPKETMGYYFYFPPVNKIVVARYAQFFKKRLISQEIRGRAVDLEEVQKEEDTTPSEITCNIPQEVEGFEPPQEEVIPICRSERTHRALNRLCLNVEVKKHSLRDLGESADYKAAMLNPKSRVMTSKLQNDILMFQQHQERIERFKKVIFKQREEINDKMAEMFRLLRDLTSSGTLEKALVREEASNPVTKNINTMSLIKMEKEKGIEGREVAKGNVIELNELEALEPIESPDNEEEMEEGTCNTPKMGRGGKYVPRALLHNTISQDMRE
nr:retrovirus-related Pol polyprotein from transposon TNT 1-94 [Tanacetum cinerariifolium]